MSKEKAIVKFIQGNTAKFAKGVTEKSKPELTKEQREIVKAFTSLYGNDYNHARLFGLVAGFDLTAHLPQQARGGVPSYPKFVAFMIEGNANGHNYPIGTLVVTVNHHQGMMVNGAIGNTLSPLPSDCRPATAEEISKSMSRIQLESLMEMVVFLEEKGQEAA